MALILKVHHSGYYSWLKRPTSKRKAAELVLVDKIKVLQEANRRRLGSPRITKELRKQGMIVGENRVAKLIRNVNLGAIYKKKAFRRPQNLEAGILRANLLNRQFAVPAPESVWVSDITYLPTRQGWAYLCMIMDLYNREIVGWSYANHMETALVKDAFDQAWQQRAGNGELLFHSDQGTQYTSKDFQQHLKEVSKEIKQSMSRRGNCWDNAVAESFFKTLKREVYELKDNLSFTDLKRELFIYIDGYYNRRRPHSTLGNLSPLEFKKTRMP